MTTALAQAAEQLRAAVTEERFEDAEKALISYRAATESLLRQGLLTRETLAEARDLLGWARALTLAARAGAAQQLAGLRPPAYSESGQRRTWEIQG